MNKIILGTNAALGLGDQLQYSTLPEEFSKLGYEFYLSNKMIFRNEEIKQLVWGCNPFVKGESDQHPNAGETEYCGNWKSTDRVINNYIDYIENRHGIVSNNKTPKIYYKYNIIEKFKDVVVFDFNAMSIYEYFTVDYNKTINELTSKFKDYQKILIKHKHSFAGLNIQNNLFDEQYIINNIFEYCDIINSCKEFVALYSGSYVLSSAIKSPQLINILLTSKKLEEIKVSKGYYFEDINYISI